MMKLLDGVFAIVSGEWLLRGYPNGGTVIILRTIFVSGLLFAAYIALQLLLKSGFDWLSARAEVSQSVGVLGALIAFVYASLYTRFASQWSYLASLYNQIVAAQALGKLEGTKAARESFDCWIAGFIEDAENLHLATKPTFAPAIHQWLDDEGVKASFIEGAPGGAERYARLYEMVKLATQHDAKTHGEQAPPVTRRAKQLQLELAPLEGESSK